MARQRAVILEIRGRAATVLADGGEFLRVRAPRGSVIGDEIDLGVAPLRFLQPQFALVATLVLMLTFGGVGLNALALSFNNVTTYVTVDINPSVELGVNRWGWVITARGLNQEGTDLLANTDYRAARLSEFVPELTKKAAEQGYVGPDKPNSVIIASVPVKQASTTATVARELVKAEEKTVTAAAPTTPTNPSAPPAPPVSVTSITVSDPTVRDGAKDANMSVGKYAVVLEAQKNGVEVSASEVEEEGLTKAIEKHGGKVGDIVKAAKDEGDFGKLATEFGEKIKKKDQHSGHDSTGQQSDGSQGQTQGGSPDPSTPGSGHTEGSGNGNTGSTGSTGTTGNTGNTGSGQQGSGQTGSGGDDKHRGNGHGDSSTGNKSSGKGSIGNSGDSGDKGNSGNKGNGKSKGSGISSRFADGWRELQERLKHSLDNEDNEGDRDH